VYKGCGDCDDRINELEIFSETAESQMSFETQKARFFSYPWVTVMID
jgi:hypothetical protein